MARAAVVGAGFAGLIVARELARAGVAVDLYEEHRRVGYPKHCTGLVSEGTVRLIGGPAERAVQAWVDRLVLSAGEDRLALRVRVARLDRVSLEEMLLEEAVSLGVRPLLGTRVSRADLARGLVWAGGDSREYDLVVIAEGLHGPLREGAGIRHRPLTSMGLNMEVSCPRGQDEILVIVEPSGGAWFSWLAPAGPGRIVAGSLGPHPGSVRRSMERLAGECGPGEIYGGRVIHGPPMSPRLAAGPRHLIVGDAAALNKPLTGGGLYPNALLASLLRQQVEEGASLNSAAGEAYRRVYRVLAGQYRLARTLLGGMLYSVVREAARSGLDLERELVDYDDHARLPWLAARRAPLRAALLAGRLLARSPLGSVRLLLAALWGAVRYR